MENLIGAIDSFEAFITVQGKVNYNAIHMKSGYTYLIIHAISPSTFPCEDEYILAGVKDSSISINFRIEDDFPSVQLSNIHGLH